MEGPLHVILYYAMGGGLGHLTRSFAILSKCPPSFGPVRLMTSSNLTPMVMSHAPCPVDYIQGDLLSSKSDYIEFLNDYIRQYQIKVVVVDTFPYGIVGEWLWINQEIPRILIARNLKWESYAAHVRKKNGHSSCPDRFPCFSLIIEPIEATYNSKLKSCSEIHQIHGPILLETNGKNKSPNQNIKGYLIVHSGSKEECEHLIQLADEKMTHPDQSQCPIEKIFSTQKIYPAENVMHRYSTIISGAGYNMVAIASQAPPTRKHILHPFERKFDDQFFRLGKYMEGSWGSASKNQAMEVAIWLTQKVTCIAAR